MIVIRPNAGLCNRMRALDSALALGRVAGVPVRLCWPLDDDLNCPFERLFEPLHGLESFENKVDRQIASSMAAKNSRGLAKKIVPLVRLVKIARRARRLVRNLDPKSRVIGQEDTEFCLANPGKLIGLAKRYDLHIFTFDRFFRGDEDFLGFRPVPEIFKRIEQVSLGGRNVVGVHVRRGDHELSKEHSPIQGFISSMRSLSDSDPTLEFFVASDSEEMEHRLDREFPGRILRQADKSYARDKPEGAIHAVADLFCLASCKSLIGSFDSSFTETACEIGKIPCAVVDAPMENS